MQHMNSEQIWFLASVWETRSLQQTAKQLGISLATASRLMTAARELLQDPLFVHGAGGYIPTPGMTSLVPKLLSAKNALVELAKPVAFDPEAFRGEVRFAGVDNAGLLFLCPVLARLQFEAPQLRVLFATLPEDWTGALASGALDMVFYAAPLKRLPSQFRSATLIETGHVLVVRRGHPILSEIEKTVGNGKAPSPRMLDRYKEIELTYGPFSTRRSGENSAPEESGNAVAAVSDFFLTGVFLALESDCFVRLPTRSAQYLQQFLPIVVLPETLRKLPTWNGRMIWHERTDFDPMLQWVRRVLMECLRG